MIRTRSSTTLTTKTHHTVQNSTAAVSVAKTVRSRIARFSIPSTPTNMVTSSRPSKNRLMMLSTTASRRTSYQNFATSRTRTSICFARRSRLVRLQDSYRSRLSFRKTQSPYASSCATTLIINGTFCRQLSQPSSFTAWPMPTHRSHGPPQFFSFLNMILEASASLSICVL